jgi:succinylglutamate desuccinylase
MQFKVLKEVPSGFLNIPSDQLGLVLDGPCLIDLEQSGKPYIFLSAMLHGNEPTGLKVVQRLLNKYKEELPFSFLILIGNVDAAKHKVRYLADQMDFNRIWNGGDSPEEKWASQVLEYIYAKKPIWGLDMHNNTGKNPLYACINHLHDELFRLSGAFSDKVVYFETPEEALGVALSKEFPAITLECGHIGDIEGLERSFLYVDTLLQKKSLDELPYNPRFKLYEVEAVVKVRESLDIYVGNDVCENAVSFLPHLEELNFAVATKGSVIAHSLEKTSPVTIEGVNYTSLHDDYLKYENGELRLIKDVVPSMISLNPTIIRQDCLGYFMMEKRI